jgi:sulfur dioxygenase
VLIRGCGRTDFPAGKVEVMYNAIHQQIYSLPDNVIILPGHDYNGLPCSTVGEEKQWNKRTNKGLPEFQKIMANLGLSLPRQIALALALNPKDGEL